ncbi:hypothetical protein TSUD_418940, partial [Trifolium subterraneum]
IEHIPLFHVLLWVQVHNLPMGLMKEKVGKALANYIGTFVEYDKNNNSSFWRQYMRIRVRVDVRQPLKKDTKMKNKEGQWCTVNFKYEKMGVFCFVCGIMGHAKNKCEVRFAMEHDDGKREWTADIRADPKRQGGRQVSRWLREERGGREGRSGEEREAPANNSVTHQSSGPTSAEVADNGKGDIPNINHQKIMTRQSHSMVFQPSKPNNSDGPTNQYPPNITINIPANQISPSNTQSSHPTLNSLNNQMCQFPFTHGTDKTLNLRPNSYVPSASNQSFPIIFQRPETENFDDQLLPHQSLVFNSKQKLQDPPQVIKATHKITRGNHRISMPTRTIPSTKTDPKADQSRPDKKPKHINPKANPIPNLNCKTQTHDDTQEMEPGLPGPMKILSWNCRGLSTPSAIPNLRNIAQGHQPDILFLSETLSKAQTMERVRVSLKFNSCLSVDVEGRSGGLSVMWRDTIKCRVMNYSRNFINLVVEDKEEGEWRLTCYYGYPERGRRSQAWKLLRELRDMSDLPWCIIGDFNDLLSQEDKRGNHPHPNWLCNGFRTVVGDCDLTDIHLEGYPYTWIKSRGSSNVIEERLDRAMANLMWLMKYPDVRLLNLLASHSDHSPILLQSSPMVRNGTTYTFRFENMWLKEEDVEEVVVDGWGRERGVDITSRTTRCADKPQRWGRRKRMKFKQEVAECGDKMERLRGSHNLLDSGRYKEVQERHAKLLIQEETYWRKRAKMQWLREGDLNTNF